MKFIKFFAPLLVVASLLGACGDSSVTRQDVVDFMVETSFAEQQMSASPSEEGLGEFLGCVVDELKADTGDSYEEMLNEIKRSVEGKYSKYDDVNVEDMYVKCAVNSREFLEFAIAMSPAFPEDTQIDLSDSDNFQREAIAAMINFYNMLERSDDVGYCVADYIADNSGDSPSDFLIVLLFGGTKYDSLSVDARFTCIDS